MTRQATSGADQSIAEGSSSPGVRRGKSARRGRRSSSPCPCPPTWRPWPWLPSPPSRRGGSHDRFDKKMFGGLGDLGSHTGTGTARWEQPEVGRGQAQHARGTGNGGPWPTDGLTVRACAGRSVWFDSTDWWGSRMNSKFYAIKI